nr:unnamed protein product [Callosobruchus analis]
MQFLIIVCLQLGELWKMLSVY